LGKSILISSVLSPTPRRARSAALLAVALAVGVLLASPLFAQGLPTATINGRVINEGQGLPGVTVTATSPTLQGARVTVTSANGGYVFAAVPPGYYTITFAISGFQTVTKQVAAGASQQVQTDATMSLTAVKAEAVVTARSESISQTTQEATTYSTDLLQKLPTARTITSAVILSPGVNQNGLNGVSIAGAMSTENNYTVNGVVIIDNVRSTPNTLFIEDAIQETTTITSGVSAEFGRFTGGVINTITKSGGNNFSGSLRSTFTNDAWASTNAYRTSTGVNPQVGTFVNKAIPTWEATFGGPILTDKLWFFLAGRYFDTSDARSQVTRFTNIPVTYGSKEDRYEAKLTFSPLQNHTLTGSYLAIDHSDVNYNYDVPADTNVFYNRQLPQSQAVINYNGVWTDSLFVDGFYSKRKFTFENSGSRATDLVNGTPVKDVNLGVVYNSPTFCGVCSPETRDNDDIVVKGTYFLSTPSLGSHTLLAGYDDYRGMRKSNNYQSGSNYTLYSQTASIVKGQNIYPVFDSATYLVYWPILQLSQGNVLQTRSAFVNDTWRLGDRLSFNVGVRYDKNHAVDQGGNTTSNDSAFSPRLAASYDVKADGALRVSASYSKYVAALQDTQAGSGATLAGSPAIFYWYYDGPGATPINADPSKPLVSPSDAVKQFFAWWQSQGCLPNPLASSCQVPLGGPPSISGVNIQIQGSLASPYANEYVLGLAGTFNGSRGSFSTRLVRREYGNFYDLEKNISTGKVTSPVNPDQRYDLGYIVNSNDYTRNYTGLHTEFAYRIGDRFNFGGNWTWSHLIGDIVGETSGSGPTRGGGHAYPEYFNRSWNNPVGSLTGDERHRIRLWGTYDLPIPARFGNLNFGLIQSIDSGQPYGAIGTVKTGAYVKNPGYLTPPTSVNYYFTARDAYRTPDVWQTDLSLTYSYKIKGAVELYVIPRIYNIINAQQVNYLPAVNTTVNTATNSSTFAAFNPFTTAAPIECPQGAAAATCKAMGANYQKSSLFGQPTGAIAYQTARTFQLSVGVRF
jgi:outer membrane receptor protein involved in Fe transport